MSDNSIEQAAKLIGQLKSHLQKSIIINDETIDLVCVCLLARGHLLIEDVPGLGKTTLAKALANSLALEFKRIQCTPDLLPSDITGVSIFNQQQKSFEFMPGPIFTNFLLADEINRTSPRTQSALLEAMAERTVTTDNETRKLPDTFMVIATQNPIEFNGTYPLPEAQLDRFFMRIALGYPDSDQELQILDLVASSLNTPITKPIVKQELLTQLQTLCNRITVKDNVKQYIVDLIRKTRNHNDIRLGASPRGGIALMQAAKALALMQGQAYVTPEMIQTIVKPILNHRILLKSSTKNVDTIIGEIIKQTPIPGMPNLAATAEIA